MAGAFLLSNFFTLSHPWTSVVHMEDTHIDTVMVSRKWFEDHVRSDHRLLQLSGPPRHPRVPFEECTAHCCREAQAILQLEHDGGPIGTARYAIR